MERLSFELPDFTRCAFVSSPAKKIWETRLGAIGRAWSELEVASVKERARRCALITVPPIDYPAAATELAEMELSSAPLEALAFSTSSYSNSSTPARPGEAFELRIVVGEAASVREFQLAWASRDHLAVGALLGYPRCCVEFFSQVWDRENYRDTTWAMALRSVAGASRDHVFLEVFGPPESNILWRWMGVRMVPHLPCSFHCEETVAFARKIFGGETAKRFPREVSWMREILSQPVEWSALHGIAEIKTPIMKVSTKTDATKSKYVVRYRGPVSSGLPRVLLDEAALGLSFPYAEPEARVLSGSERFRRGIENAEKVQRDWEFLENGFLERAAMEAAHRPLIAAAVGACTTSGGRVIDLGCGNGLLLKKIAEANPALSAGGVDREPQKIARAKTLLPTFASNFFAGDLFDAHEVWRERALLTIVMPGRFEEVSPERGASLRETLRKNSDRILVYAYGDWLARPGGLRGLVERAGMRFVEGDDPSVGFAELA